MIRLSENNATLTQVRTTYQKFATSQIWKLSKVNLWTKFNMPNDSYSILLNLEFFHNLFTLFLLWRLKIDFEVTKNVKILTFEGDWSESLAFPSKNNLQQNTLKNVKRSSKFRQGQKTLIFVLGHLLSASPKYLFLQGRLDTRLRPHAALRLC